MFESNAMIYEEERVSEYSFPWGANGGVWLCFGGLGFECEMTWPMGRELGSWLFILVPRFRFKDHYLPTGTLH